MTALTSLATAADLTARNIVIPAGVDSTALLAAASDAIRDAAQCAITQQTSTVTLIADQREWLDLPFGPVQTIDSVTLNGNAITGWKKVGDSLVMPTGWFSYPDVLPFEVVATYTHGLSVVPADIVDLACGMVSMAVVKAGGGYGSGSRLTQFTSGGISQSYNLATSVDSPSPFTLPDLIRDRLRARFGGSAQVVGIRR